MTEAEWLACNSTQRMLAFLGNRASDRKLRLFACACCRRSWDRLNDERLRLSIETAERFADGLVGQKKRGSAFAAAKNPGTHSTTSPACVGFAASLCSVKDVRLWINTIWFQSVGGGRHEAATADLLREVAGNPFRPPTADPRWLTPNVVDLARTVYEERELPSGELDRTRLAVLADALLDAGCDDEEILDHCRSEGPHVRGCWAVDLLLEKS